MPGMAASSRIFEYLDLPLSQFSVHLLEWSIPERDITLADYARSISEQIAHRKPVLIGVSFGGIIIQEIARFLPVRKVVIISSVKKRSEFPKRLLIARYTGLHRILPTSLINKVELLSRYSFNGSVSKRLALYEQYLSVRDTYYLDWCIEQLINWTQTDAPEGIVHIHGELDAVFPIKNIQKCIVVPEGTHTMIIHRYKWFNEQLPTIILEDRSCM